MNEPTIFDAMSVLFTNAWHVLTSFYIPGTNVTPAAALLFSSFTFIALKFLVHLFGVGSIQGSNVAHAQRTRAGRSHKGD